MGMKKLLFIILCFSVAVFITSCKNTDFIFNYMLYDSIEYNGVIYNRISYDDMPEAYEQNPDLQLPVHIVDSKQQTRTDRTYYASAIVGDEEFKYLYFDSAHFMRSDLFN